MLHMLDHRFFLSLISCCMKHILDVQKPSYLFRQGSWRLYSHISLFSQYLPALVCKVFFYFFLLRFKIDHSPDLLNHIVSVYMCNERKKKIELKIKNHFLYA